PRPRARWTRSSRRPPGRASPTSSPLRPTWRRSSWSSTVSLPTAAEFSRRGVADHRKALAGGCVRAAACVTLIAADDPSLAAPGSLDKLVESYPDVLKSLFGISGGGSLGSGAGFLDAELFSFMLPLLVLVLGIGSGARAFAGEEDAGR